MNWIARTCIALLALSASGLAQSVPWPAGEKLVFQLSWQGVGLGRFYLSADPISGGWKFKGKLEPQGIASLLGYGLEAESQIGGDFFTDRFWKNLTVPSEGTTKLLFERQENNGSWAKVTKPDGKQTGWSSGEEETLDDLSAIYYLRVHPEIRQVNVVDYPKLAQGKWEYLGKNGDGRSGYRFAREGLLVEIWYRADAARTPVKIIFGRDFGRIEANLIENQKPCPTIDTCSKP